MTVNRNIESYVLKIDNWIDPDLCQSVLEDLSNSKWRKHRYDGDPEDLVRPPEEQLNVTLGRDVRAAELLSGRIRKAFDYYSVSRQMPWFGAPASHSEPQFHRYKPGNTMVEHCDHLVSLFDGDNFGIPILTVVTIFNDDFTGGEFILWGDTTIPMKAGTIVIFPSNFMFPHRVAPIVSGLRFSAVSWAW